MKKRYIKEIECHLEFCLKLMDLLFPNSIERDFLTFDSDNDDKHRIYSDLTILYSFNGGEYKHLESTQLWEDLLDNYYYVILGLEEMLLNMVKEAADLDKLDKYRDKIFKYDS